MEIRIVDETGNDQLLDGPARSQANYATGPIGPITIGDTTVIQVVPKVGALAASIYQRGNTHGVLGFTAMREFASAAEALAWSTIHTVTVRRRHTLQIVDGGSTLTLSAGALGPITYDPNGVELLINYRFLFAAATAG